MNIKSNKTMNSTRILTIFLSLIMSENAFAANAFADAHNDHRQWIFHAYVYCIGLGLATLFILILFSFIFRTKTKSIVTTVSTFLKEHPVCGIIVAGIIWAILLGINLELLWEAIWLFAITPFVVFFICFPFLLAINMIREKCMLSPFMLKWTGMLTISAIIASILFIILTQCGILPVNDITYLAHYYRSNKGLYMPSHPYDSILEIWTMPLFFMAQIIVAIAIYYLGKLCQYLYEKFIKI